MCIWRDISGDLGVPSWLMRPASNLKHTCVPQGRGDCGRHPEVDTHYGENLEFLRWKRGCIWCEAGLTDISTCIWIYIYMMLFLLRYTSVYPEREGVLFIDIYIYACRHARCRLCPGVLVLDSTWRAKLCFRIAAEMKWRVEVATSTMSRCGGRGSYGGGRLGREGKVTSCS